MLVCDGGDDCIELFMLGDIYPPVVQRAIILRCKTLLGVVKVLFGLLLDVEAIDVSASFNKCLSEGKSESLRAPRDNEDLIIQLEKLISISTFLDV